MTDTTIAASICPNCLLMAFNADDSGLGPNDPTPCSLLPPGAIITLADDDADPHFSHRDCDGCGAIAGDRIDILID